MTDDPPRRRWPRRLLLLLFVAFVAIQFVPHGRDHTNPPVTGEPDWDSPRTRELFMTVCGDCHSHETRWPWYAHVAPASWLVEKDVEEGRDHFNVSTWNITQRHGTSAAGEYESGEMPLWFYLPLHPSANLGEEERRALLSGMRATFGE